MRNILVTLCIAASSLCSFGDDVYIDKLASMRKEFVAGAYKTANLAVFDATKGNMFEGWCDSILANISFLESQYSVALVRYDLDLQISKGGEVEEVIEVYGENADDLEKIRLVLDYQLKTIILRERLKDINERHKKLKLQLNNKTRPCCDIEEFVARLARAKKVEMRYYEITKSEAEYNSTVLTVEDEDKIKNLHALFSSIKFQYIPNLGSGGAGTMLVVNDYDVIMIGENSVACRVKAYTCSEAKTYNIREQVRKVLESDGSDHDTKEGEALKIERTSLEIEEAIGRIKGSVKERGSAYLL